MKSPLSWETLGHVITHRAADSAAGDGVTPQNHTQVVLAPDATQRLSLRVRCLVPGVEDVYDHCF